MNKQQARLAMAAAHVIVNFQQLQSAVREFMMDTTLSHMTQRTLEDDRTAHQLPARVNGQVAQARIEELALKGDKVTRVVLRVLQPINGTGDVSYLVCELAPDGWTTRQALYTSTDDSDQGVTWLDLPADGHADME